VSRVLGLDIGGTHCRARLSVDGQVVGTAEADSASLTAIGALRAGQALSEVLARLSLDSTALLDAVGVGSAGTGSAAAEAFLTGLLAPLTRSGIVVIVNDARLVLPAAGAYPTFWPWSRCFTTTPIPTHGPRPAGRASWWLAYRPRRAHHGYPAEAEVGAAHWRGADPGRTAYHGCRPPRRGSR
jgi:hypothetical protein